METKLAQDAESVSLQEHCKSIARTREAMSSMFECRVCAGNPFATLFGPSPKAQEDSTGKQKKKKADRAVPHPPSADSTRDQKQAELQTPAMVQPPPRILNPGTQAMSLSFGNGKMGSGSDSDNSAGEFGQLGSSFDISRPDSRDSEMSVPQ